MTSSRRYIALIMDLDEAQKGANRRTSQNLHLLKHKKSFIPNVQEDTELSPFLNKQAQPISIRNIMHVCVYLKNKITKP